MTGIDVVAMGGATSIGRFVRTYGRRGLGRRLTGLCDRAELPHFLRALIDEDPRAPHPGPADLAAWGFFVCDGDLEEELITALTPTEVVRVVAASGDLATFRRLQQQPAHRGQSLESQLHRFFGSASGRKISYAARLAAAVPDDRIPRPLSELLTVLCSRGDD